jgi:hypothetical protein
MAPSYEKVADPWCRLYIHRHIRLRLDTYRSEIYTFHIPLIFITDISRHFSFVFERSRVKVSARQPTSMTDVFTGLLSSSRKIPE